MNWKRQLSNTVRQGKLWNCLGVLLVPFVVLVLGLQSAVAVPLTFAWDAGQNWPNGTTIELEVNGVTANAIAATQYTLDVPVQPGEVISVRVRAIPPTGYECGDPLGPCPPSPWTTLEQTLPAVPTGVWGNIETIGGNPMALSIAELTSGSGTSNPATTASISPTSGRQWLAAVAVSLVGGYETTSSDTVAITGAGLTWTAVGQVKVFGSRRGLYVLKGTGTPSSGALTITFTPGAGATFESFKWGIVEITSTDATPYGTAYTNSGSGTAASVTVSETPDAGDFVFFVHAQEDNNTDSLNSELDTSLIRIGNATGARRFGISYDTSPDSTPVPGVTWTGSCAWAAIGFVINAGSSAAVSMDATAQAVASATGAVTMAVPVAATSAAVATASGTLAMALPLQATASVTATAAGNLLLEMALGGGALAAALAVGALGLTMPLSGSASGEVTASGTLGLGAEIDLSGDAVVEASATGAIASTTALAGDAAAIAAGAGDITLTTVLAGSALAEALATAGITLETALAAQAAAQATATGDVGMTTPLAGDAAAQVTATGDVVALAEGALAGDAAALASATGDVKMTTPLAGDAAAQASATGDVEMTIPLAGDAAAQASATGDLDSLADGSLAGAAAAQAIATGTVDLSTFIAGTAQAVVTAGGALGMSVPLAGSATVVVLATGNLQVSLRVPLSAAALAAAAADGSLLMSIPLSGAALANAVAQGTLSGGVETFIPLPARTWAPGYIPRIWHPAPSNRTWVGVAGNRIWR